MIQVLLHPSKETMDNLDQYSKVKSLINWLKSL